MNTPPFELAALIVVISYIVLFIVLVAVIRIAGYIIRRRRGG